MAKTIDVQAKEWRDKVNGNSYFSACVTVDYGMESEKTYRLPFQYGYGDQYMAEAAKVLDESGDVPNPRQEYGGRRLLSLICRESGIILRYSKERNCLQRDVKRWGEAE
jgi:hypothetical protein